jgi:predicted transposase YbfD/YdcC
MVDAIRQYFRRLPDPRSVHGRRHRLDEMVIVAILAVICSADSWAEVAAFGRAKLKWLKTFLELRRGIPSHDTFGRVFAAIKPEAFERCFVRWIEALAQVRPGELIAIDGKTLRRSFDRSSETAAIHMISAWSSANGLVFAQMATDAKSNEITAIPRLLDLLDLKGVVISIDAMGCQKAIASKIIEGGGDYVLSLKGNQSTLHEEVAWWMDQAIAGKMRDARLDRHRQVNKNHGRVETREVWCVEQIDWFADRGQWAGLSSLVAVDSERRFDDGRVEKERRYFISSLKGKDAETFARLVRSHWQIENQLHWSLDVSFSEDASRIRNGYAAENFSRLRRIALNLLKRETTEKLGIKGKRLRSAWDEQYLLKVLTGG